MFTFKISNFMKLLIIFKLDQLDRVMKFPAETNFL